MMTRPIGRPAGTSSAANPGAAKPGALRTVATLAATGLVLTGCGSLAVSSGPTRTGAASANAAGCSRSRHQLGGWHRPAAAQDGPGQGVAMPASPGSAQRSHRADRRPGGDRAGVWRSPRRRRSRPGCRVGHCDRLDGQIRRGGGMCAASPAARDPALPASPAISPVSVDVHHSGPGPAGGDGARWRLPAGDRPGPGPLAGTGAVLPGRAWQDCGGLGAGPAGEASAQWRACAPA